MSEREIFIDSCTRLCYPEVDAHSEECIKADNMYPMIELSRQQVLDISNAMQVASQDGEKLVVPGFTEDIWIRLNSDATFSAVDRYGREYVRSK